MKTEDDIYEALDLFLAESANEVVRTVEAGLREQCSHRPDIERGFVAAGLMKLAMKCNARANQIRGVQ